MICFSERREQTGSNHHTAINPVTRTGSALTTKPITKKPPTEQPPRRPTTPKPPTDYTPAPDHRKKPKDRQNPGREPAPTSQCYHPETRQEKPPGPNEELCTKPQCMAIRTQPHKHHQPPKTADQPTHYITVPPTNAQPILLSSRSRPPARAPKANDSLQCPSQKPEKQLSRSKTILQLTAMRPRNTSETC